MLWSRLAGLLIRTVYNLTAVDAGFDRARLVTFQMSLPNADYPQAAARAPFYQRLLETLRGVAGIQGASAMSGLPPDRPVDANTTDIGNYTAPGASSAFSCRPGPRAQSVSTRGFEQFPRTQHTRGSHWRPPSLGAERRERIDARGPTSGHGARGECHRR